MLLLIYQISTHCPIASSVSHTTRQIRKDEEQGKDYSFVSRDIFLKGIETVKFILSQTKTSINKLG